MRTLIVVCLALLSFSVVGCGGPGAPEIPKEGEALDPNTAPDKLDKKDTTATMTVTE